MEVRVFLRTDTDFFSTTRFYFVDLCSLDDAWDWVFCWYRIQT